MGEARYIWSVSRGKKKISLSLIICIDTILIVSFQVLIFVIQLQIKTSKISICNASNKMIGCLSNYSFDNFLFKTWHVNHSQGGWWWYFYRPSQFSFNNSETVKPLNLAFCSISKFSLEIFMSNLVLLTGPSLQILKISIWFTA